MLRKLLFLFFALLLVFNLSASELIIQLKNREQLDHFIQKSRNEYPNLEFIKTLSRSWNIYLFEIPEAQKQDCIYQLIQWDMIQHIQSNRKAKPRQTSPNDPGYAQQWHHNNIGLNGGTVGADIQSEWAWDFSTGSSGITAMGDTIVLAVVDEGIDLNSSDLNLWKNWQEIPNNNIDDDGNGYIDDYHGWNAFAQNGVILINNHGTTVAGAAAAIGNNNFGVSGVNWNVQIMPVAVNDYTEAEIIRAYSYLFDQRKLYNQSNGTKGAYIVVANSSFGVDNAFEHEFPLWCSLYDSLGSVGILSVAATTNKPENVDIAGDIPSLCSSPYLMAVTNTNRNDQLAAAGYGKVNIDLGAPGTAIYTIGSNNQFGATSGTSIAAPIVSGAVSLMYSAACDSFFIKPGDQSLIIKRFILEGAEWLPDLIGKTNSNGRLNIFKSIELFLSNQCVFCMETEQIKSEITCPGDNDGALNIQIKAGLNPFSYQWNDMFSDSLRFGIKPGQYFITISDSASCQKVVQVAYKNPDPIVVDLSSFPEVNENGDGKIYTSVSGGRPPYNYEWSNGDTIDSLFNLSSGWYYLSLKDQNGNGCLVIDSVFVERNIVETVLPVFEKINIYPNPANDIIKVRFSDIKSIQLIDLSGNLLQSHNVDDKKELNISKGHLPAGIYLLKLQNKSGNEAIFKVVFL